MTIAVLCEDWLRQQSGELTDNTLQVRQWVVRQHLVPALGARRVRELSADDVTRFLQAKAEAGYARATLAKLRGTLQQARTVGGRTRAAVGGGHRGRPHDRPAPGPPVAPR